MGSAYSGLLDNKNQQVFSDRPVLELDTEPEDSDPVSPQQEEYVNLEMYDNKYYTCDSDSDNERLYALTDYNSNMGQDLTSLTKCICTRLKC